MPLFFWVAVAIALAALLIGLILRARLTDEQVWETLVDSGTPPNALPSKAPWPAEEHSDSEGEEMNNPTLSSGSTRDIDLRRSSRLERPVPLVILGTNRRGESFQENTSALAVNLHGCRYSSRHEYAPESWVTLQVTGTEGGHSPVVRARVRTVSTPQSPRELCQVGVELETPGNVWGIPAPPEDWQRLLEIGNSAAHAVAPAAPASDSSTQSSSFLGVRSSTPERRAEVTVFPGPPVAAATPTEIPGAKEPAPSKAERVVITAEQLLQALQGKIQIAAEKAVQSSLSSQLDQALKIALVKIDESWKANLRQTEEFSASRLAETQNLWEKELVIYRGRAEEISRRLEALAGNSQQTLAQTQKFVERLANETAPQLLARLNDSFARANSDFEARASLVCEHHLAQLAEGSRIGAHEAQSQLDDILAEARSLLSSAGGDISQARVESLVNSSREQTLARLEVRLGELYSGFQQQHDLTRQRTGEITRQLEALAAETRQLRSQHEQTLAELRALPANANPVIPPERLDSLVNSSREKIFNHLEWRLGEVSGHFEQLVGQARDHAGELAQQIERLSSEQIERLSTETRGQIMEARALAENSSREIALQIEKLAAESRGRLAETRTLAENSSRELAQQIEKLSAETRGQLAETRTLSEGASRELHPKNPFAVEEFVGLATKEFETAAARVSDRQLIRLMEQKQLVSQEVSLELEARASEARVLLQKSANSTLDEFRRRVEDQIDFVLAEAKERVTSSLASLDAESRAAVETRRRGLEADVARAAEQSTMEFRSGIKAFLYSCLVAAVSAVDQHAQTTLAGLSNEPNSSLRPLDAILGSSATPDTPPGPPKANSASK
jgi:hypothetical protein